MICFTSSLKLILVRSFLILFVLRSIFLCRLTFSTWFLCTEVSWCQLLLIIISNYLNEYVRTAGMNELKKWMIAYNEQRELSLFLLLGWIDCSHSSLSTFLFLCFDLHCIFSHYILNFFLFFVLVILIRLFDYKLTKSNNPISNYCSPNRLSILHYLFPIDYCLEK